MFPLHQQLKIKQITRWPHLCINLWFKKHFGLGLIFNYNTFQSGQVNFLSKTILSM